MSRENTDGFHEASLLLTHGKRRVDNDVSVLSSCAGPSEPQQEPMNVVRFRLGSPESSESTTHVPSNSSGVPWYRAVGSTLLMLRPFDTVPHVV